MVARTLGIAAVVLVVMATLATLVQLLLHMPTLDPVTVGLLAASGWVMGDGLNQL